MFSCVFSDLREGFGSRTTRKVWSHHPTAWTPNHPKARLAVQPTDQLTARRPTRPAADRPIAHLSCWCVLSKTWFESSHLRQADSSYLGQEVIASDPVWEIISLVEHNHNDNHGNNDIVPLWRIVFGACRPKADFFGGWLEGEGFPQTLPTCEEACCGQAILSAKQFNRCTTKLEGVKTRTFVF